MKTKDITIGTAIRFWQAAGPFSACHRYQETGTVVSVWECGNCYTVEAGETVFNVPFSAIIETI